jgi:hypothetical protein
MPRVSAVWKGNGHMRGLPNHGVTTSFSKHQRHESLVASHWHRKKPLSCWMAICTFLFLLVLCLFILPAPSLDVSESSELRPQGLVRKGLQGLPLQQASHALREEVEDLHLGDKSKEWQLKPDHFTLFNLSSKSSCRCQLHPLSLCSNSRKATTSFLMVCSRSCFVVSSYEIRNSVSW